MKLTITLDETTQDTEIATDPPMDRDELIMLLYDLQLALKLEKSYEYWEVEAARTWH